MRKVFLFCLMSIFLYACSSNQSGNQSSTSEGNPSTNKDVGSYDPSRGEGKFDHVDLGEKLDVTMVKEGKSISDLKCISCHKLTDEKLVGPGWKGVTERRTPQWIMNFITNPDPMIDKDPVLQEQLAICLTRMPNQNISDDEARKILEFMRQNDGVQ